MEQSKKRLKETQEELSEEAAAKVCSLFTYLHLWMFEFTLSVVILQFCNRDICSRWMLNLCDWDMFLLRKLHNIGFGVSTESEMSVSLSPFGMFSVLLCALLPTVCQAPDNELIDIIINWCYLKAKVFLANVVEPDSEQKDFCLLSFMKKFVVKVFYWNIYQLCRFCDNVCNIACSLMAYYSINNVISILLSAYVIIVAVVNGNTLNIWLNNVLLDWQIPSAWVWQDFLPNRCFILYSF